MSNDKLAERQRFEEWYTTHAHNYSINPIGSRDCSLQWESWKAALAVHSAQAQPPANTERLAELLRGLEIGPMAATLSPKKLFAIGAAIAAQAKEAQPPAASVTDEMVMRLKHALPLLCADVTMADARAALEAALAAAPQQAAEPVYQMRNGNAWFDIPRKQFARIDSVSTRVLYTTPQAGEPVGHARTDGCMHFAYLPWSVKDGDPVYAAPPAERVQEKAEPVAWMHPELHKGHPYPEECLSTEAFDGWLPLYTHPQPAQDASKYQELLMAVEKKFPGESRHETALRYIRETELQSCEPKCDTAMAKESGR